MSGCFPTSVITTWACVVSCCSWGWWARAAGGFSRPVGALQHTVGGGPQLLPPVPPHLASLFFFLKFLILSLHEFQAWVQIFPVSVVPTSLLFLMLLYSRVWTPKLEEVLSLLLTTLFFQKYPFGHFYAIWKNTYPKYLAHFKISYQFNCGIVGTPYILKIISLLET